MNNYELISLFITDLLEETLKIDGIIGIKAVTKHINSRFVVLYLKTDFDDKMDVDPAIGLTYDVFFSLGILMTKWHEKILELTSDKWFFTFFVPFNFFVPDDFIIISKLGDVIEEFPHIIKR